MRQLLQMTLQGSVLIGALLMLRPLFRRRVSPVILYALWLLPAARLLIPGTVASAFSLQNLVPAGAERQAAAVLEQGTVQVPRMLASQPAALSRPADLGQVSAGAAVDLGTLLTVLWALGTAAVLLAALARNCRFSRGVRRGAVEVEAACPLPVYLSEGLTSPCLCGLFRPAIFLCDRALDSQARLDMALDHELGHWRAGDRFWALLRLACCAMHWFNPLVWAAARFSMEDCERACDHRVLRHAGREEREAYGLLLLSYTERSRGGVLLTSSPMGAGRRALWGRIALIAQRPATRRTALAALALCVGLAALAACTGRTAGEDGCQALIRLARQEEVWAEVTGGSEGALLGEISGETFANFLNTRQWERLEAAPRQESEGIPAGGITLRDSSGRRLGTLRFWSDGATGDCRASVELPEGGEETVFYAVSPRDQWIAAAMTRIGREDCTLRSALPGGGEMVLVCSDPAMGTEYHSLFYTEDGETYTPIDSDLDGQYSRVAEQMRFISGEVGFVSFRFEEINGYSAPNLYRTEDGGVTWRRVELPMGDVTTASGYTGMHVLDMEFEDARSGCVTVGMSYGGQENSLSCVFVTDDGGRTWGTVTSSRYLLGQPQPEA